MITQQKFFKSKTKRINNNKNITNRKIAEKIAFTVIWACALIAISALVAIVTYVLVNGIRVIDLEFLTTRPAGGVSGEGGMSTTIVTTIYLVILTTTIAAPLGIFAAVYIVEYAEETEYGRGFIRTLVKYARIGVEILAGVPSIVFGLFGFIVFVSRLKLNFSLLSASLSGACLILPVIIRRGSA